jgi:DNA-binding CsgD family transcriptional regulator
MSRPSSNEQQRFWLVLSVLVGVIAIGGLSDLYHDHSGALTPFHIAFELGFLGFSLGSVTYLWLAWMRTRSALAGAREALSVDRAERDLWRKRTHTLLGGLSEEIESQLRRWGLTPVERQTALLLLKGCGHKQIAQLLGKSERTVRQQAVAVYRKSGLGGRAELAGFFLENLRLPATDHVVPDPLTSPQRSPLFARPLASSGPGCLAEVSLERESKA